MMRSLKLIAFVCVFIFASCKTNLVYINVINPAPVTISKESKRAGIISRTKPSTENKTLNTIHQNANAQSEKLIKEASAECMSGLNNALIENKQFEIVKVVSDRELQTPVTGSFAAPLSWLEVETICKEQGVDLLFVLEVFDTQLQIVPVNVPNKIENVTDVINTVTQTQVNIITQIKTGWRIYDPVKKYIIDEYPLGNSLSFTMHATTALSNVEALMGRKEAIKTEANRLGRVYADRVIPYWITVTRDYYVKGNSDFKTATRKARTGNWTGAGELWLKQTTSAKRKIAGRGCYNMAILGEINGDLDSAISWAQKAYENYNNKLALPYVNTLKRRQQLVQKLDYQTGN